MITALYFFNFATYCILTIVTYFYYIINKNKNILDFFSVTFVATISYVFAVSKNYAINEVTKSLYMKTSVLFGLAANLMLMFFIYEVTTQKNIRKKHNFLIALVIILASAFAVEFYVDTVDIGLFKMTSVLIFVLTSLEVIFILMTKVNEISSEMKSYIIKFMTFFMFTLVIEDVLKRGFNIQADNVTRAIFNTFIISFIFNKIKVEITALQNKQGSIQEVEYGNLDAKLQEKQITDREDEIVRLIICGKTNQEIADDLFISINTVKIHVYNIYRKFEVNKRSELINLLKDNGDS